MTTNTTNTANYYNFSGVTVAPDDVANQIKDAVTINVLPKGDLDTKTVRNIAVAVDIALSGMMEHLSVMVIEKTGIHANLDPSDFEDIYQEICDRVESKISEGEVEVEFGESYEDFEDEEDEEEYDYYDDPYYDEDYDEDEEPTSNLDFRL